MAVDWPSRGSRGKGSNERHDAAQQEKREKRKEFRASIAQDYRQTTRPNAGMATGNIQSAIIYAEDSYLWHYNPKTGREELTDNSRNRYERFINRRDPHLLNCGDTFKPPSDIREQRPDGTRKFEQDAEFSQSRPTRRRFASKVKHFSQAEIDALNKG